MLLLYFITVLCKEAWVDDLCNICKDCCAASAPWEYIIITLLLH